MHEALRMAHRRQQVISALMPFRASFYEHFGYGLVERRAEWTIPISVFSAGRFDSIRFLEPGDLPALYDCRQRMVKKGQCDVERSSEFWPHVRRNAADGLEIVDSPEPGTICGYLRLVNVRENDRNVLRAVDHIWDSPEALKRQLYFLGSLRDQYSAVVLILPPDLPLNLLLKETQLAHRSVEHPVARLSIQTRTQVRIMDHKRFLEALKLPQGLSGRTTIAIAETEGTTSLIRVDLSEGRMSVSPGTSSPDLECDDKTWASIACGDLDAAVATSLGLVRLNDPRALPVLQAFSVGPRPFLTEAF
jgi:predicted acetyltransferase